MIHIFILNPKVGTPGWTKAFREHLQTIENLQYYVFSARSGENETILVRRVLHIFKDEMVRLYACGGSGCMQRLLDGIDDFESVEVAMYPVVNNDFLKVFGDKASYFGDIDKLIYGVARRIDYIKTNHGAALNHFSTGLDAKLLKIKNRLNRIGIRSKKLPYVIGLIGAALLSKNRECEAIFGELNITGKCCELVFLNGSTKAEFLEFSDNNNIEDGLAYYGYYKAMNFIERIKTILTLKKKEREKINGICEHGLTLSMSLRSLDGKAIPVSLDGEVKYYSDWMVEVVHKGLPFVLPKEVADNE